MHVQTFAKLLEISKAREYVHDTGNHMFKHIPNGQDKLC